MRNEKLGDAEEDRQQIEEQRAVVARVERHQPAAVELVDLLVQRAGSTSCRRAAARSRTSFSVSCRSMKSIPPPRPKKEVTRAGRRVVAVARPGAPCELGIRPPPPPITRTEAGRLASDIRAPYDVEVVGTDCMRWPQHHVAVAARRELARAAPWRSDHRRVRGSAPRPTRSRCTWPPARAARRGESGRPARRAAISPE